jgi:hypothetical protein
LKGGIRFSQTGSRYPSQSKTGKGQIKINYSSSSSFSLLSLRAGFSEGIKQTSCEFLLSLATLNRKPQLGQLVSFQWDLPTELKIGKDSISTVGTNFLPQFLHLSEFDGRVISSIDFWAGKASHKFRYLRNRNHPFLRG